MADRFSTEAAAEDPSPSPSARGEQIEINRAAIVAEARSWIGTPYHHQASVKHVGCDCLGLVRGVWRALLGPEPEAVPGYSSDWGEVSAQETLLAAARRHLFEIDPADVGSGDILVFRMRPGRMAKHAGIAVGRAAENLSFIHAQEGGPVCEVALSPWWQARIAAAFALPGVLREKIRQKQH